MSEAIINHLWQSTLFALLAALLTLLFRNNRADVRFHIWMAASVKFLIPFPVFVLLGQSLRWQSAPTLHALPKLSLVVEPVLRPGAMMSANFATTPLANTHAHWGIGTFISALWLLGVAALVGVRVMQLRRLQRALSASSPLHVQAPIPVRETRTTMEPGVVGIFPSVLLLPAGITRQLAPEQLDTIICHELCHWRRRDNLTASIHMLVETLFWFHPLVWWVGGRMRIERERACDEQVIESGGDRQTYAEGILKVCRSYVQPPLACAAGVSGGTLRKRIEDIMTNQVATGLPAAKRGVLVAAALAALLGPAAVGFAGVTGTAAQGAEDSAVAPGPAINGIAIDMRHYSNAQWHFALDVPKRWSEFPPVLNNSPFEVVRFLSSEGGTNALIVFRQPFDPNSGLTAVAAGVQQVLAKGGFSNFVTSETTLGAHHVLMLDFDRIMNGRPWSCREYFISDGTLLYVLGFGTSNDRNALLPLYDRMAVSFAAEDSAR